MLQNIQRNLSVFEISHRDQSFDEPMKLELSDAFLDIINLWTDLIVRMRNNPAGRDLLPAFPNSSNDY